MIGKLLDTLKFIFKHPATRNDKWSAFWRFAGWQVQSRTFRHPVVYPFVEKSQLIVHGGMTGATGNIYTGLHEFEDMMFLLHLLRPGDLFADVGANIGSYTILASAVAGADSISFEPVPETYLHLKNNVVINNADARVELHNAGVGSEKGQLQFTSGLDTMNHVIVQGSDSQPGTISVEIITLDEVMVNKRPTLIKIDTEGFEMSVLTGAKSVLQQTTLLALIVEINGACERYGVQEADIHQLLLQEGFSPVVYDAFSRTHSPKNSFNPHGNTIYVRDKEETGRRLSAARKFRILNQNI